MQGADAFDPERFIRLHEAAFNLAARIRDFTVFRNLYADLLTEGNDRAREAAGVLRERFLKDVGDAP